jgi:hypothetical protein
LGFTHSLQEFLFDFKGVTEGLVMEAEKAKKQEKQQKEKKSKLLQSYHDRFI